MTGASTLLKRSFPKDKWASGLFWAWNVIFVAFMTLGFAPRLLPDLLKAVSEGLVPVIFFINGLILSAVPLIAITLGLTRFRQAPSRLFALGYVIEGPLMLLLAVRLFLIRQATPALIFLLAVSGLGMAAFLWRLMDPDLKHGRGWGSWTRLAGLTIMLLVSLYASIWILFYAAPLLVEFLKLLVNIISDLGRYLRLWWEGIVYLFGSQLVWVPFFTLGFILLLFTATLVVLTPIVVPVLTVRAWLESLRTQVRQHGKRLPIWLVGVTTATTIALFVVTNSQPQRKAFELLQAPPATPEQAQWLKKQEKQIKKGLLNAYLAPFRYISAVGEVRHISEIYAGVFKLSPLAALRVQTLYETIARPLLYDPVYPQKTIERVDNASLTQEPQLAAQLYQRFFDATIVEGERETIVNAVRSTWSATQAEAAWQAVDEREVRLVRQEVTIQEHGDWADIELYEVYQNKTAQRQEVVYYFNLPETAVITGLWLGDSADRDKRFSYQVAPRGAAQQVYREQTRRQLDPALVEQIGPRQYRLRAFPVQPIISRYDDVTGRLITSEAPLMHLWLTYRTLADQGAWRLPQLAVKRNVYWDSKTIRLINGKPMKAEADAWLPATAPAMTEVIPLAHRVDLGNGDTVLAIPASQVTKPALPANLRLAVVLDRSYSMIAHASQVTRALEELQQYAQAGAVIDLYQTSSPFRGEGPTRVALVDISPQAIEFLGGQNPAELLAQFEELRKGRSYDAVLVLTDGSGYELGSSSAEPIIPVAPIWMIHLESDLPLGYDDQTLEAIQSSGGGVASNVNEALSRLFMAQTDENSAIVNQDMVDGYLWQVAPASAIPAGSYTVHSEDGFAALAARRLILAEMQRQRSNLQNLAMLDQLHALAIKHSIVTPYSSMIVLVNSLQQEQLKVEELNQDRFEREVEAVGETVPPSPPPLTGVPEPEEWLLIGVAVAVLAWYTVSQRAARGA